MRKIFKTICVGIFVMAMGTSCSVTKVVRQSSVADLDCNVMQIPTVAELEVDENPVTADTLWRKTLFDGKTISKKQCTSNLIASILEKNNADVLIEPKVSHESTGNIFSTSHKLTVTGYPARYAKFRTATLEDVQLMNELTKTPVATNIVIANGVVFSKTGLSKGEEKAVKIAKKKVQKARNVRKPYLGRSRGYRGYVDVGSGFDLDVDGVFSMSTIHGYMFNPYIFLGGGVNYQYIGDALCKGYGYNQYWVDANCFQIFADFKAYMSKKSFAPFVDVKLGVNIEPFGGGGAHYFSTGLGFAVKGFELAFNYNLLGGLDTSSFVFSVGWAF